MKRMQHASNNDVLGAPVGWDQNELPCSALPITRLEVNSMRAIASFWKPTAEELAQLNAGGSVCLTMMGCTVPPLSVSVEPV